MPEHGGRLIAAAKKHDIAVHEWLDLSTGISPVAWPVDSIDEKKLLQSWARLPQDDDGLTEAAKSYYGAAHLLPVAGSQAAIKALPLLRDESDRVAILSPAYNEHEHAWSEAGFKVTPFAAGQIEEVVANHDVVILVNPNNPTGAVFERLDCLKWQKQLAKKGGWLVVDEAFMDVTPGNSLAPHAGGGLIVLRSLGKFFGLAGARVGFVIASAPLLMALADEIGPWTIAGPSRLVATHALKDELFQRRVRQLLRRYGLRLAELLEKYGLKPAGQTALFSWVINEHAAILHEQLARKAILTRLFAVDDVAFCLPPLPNPLPLGAREQEEPTSENQNPIPPSPLEDEGKDHTSPSPPRGEGRGEGVNKKSGEGVKKKTSIRFGLPGEEMEWQRLEAALKSLDLAGASS